MVTPHLPWKFHANRYCRFLVMLLTKKQTKKQTKKEIERKQHPVHYRGRGNYQIKVSNYRKYGKCVIYGIDFCLFIMVMWNVGLAFFLISHAVAAKPCFALGFYGLPPASIRQLCWPPAILFYCCSLDLSSFLPANLRGRLADRHQTLPHIRRWPRFIKFGQIFGWPLSP